MKVLDYHDVQNSFEPINEEKINTLWKAERASFSHQIIVLDDDPTGVQTVHGVSVYTDWTEEIIEEGFEETGNIFFILTNSRALDSKETEHLHKTIAERIERVAAQKKVPYLIISRGDSTLRGHYPLETEVLKDTLEKQTDSKVDGEIILPYFKQGGRLTIDNVHYVKQGEKLIPAGQTEFAEDRTFGFTSSHLGEWVQEKTEGRYKKDKAIYISLASLRGLQIEAITEQLLAVQNFHKVIVNAVEEADVRVFTIALMRALRQNKKFLYRTAATFTKIIGDISEKALLEKKDLLSAESQKGGLIVIGSHVKKTTQQLEALMELGDLRFIHFDSHLIVEPEVFQKEVENVQKQVDNG
nr:four-carbon acid sugar kinase family protein [Sinobaca sp. H24]